MKVEMYRSTVVQYQWISSMSTFAEQIFGDFHLPADFAEETPRQEIPFNKVFGCSSPLWVYALKV